MRNVLPLMYFFCLTYFVSGPAIILAQEKAKVRSENRTVTIELKKAPLEGEVALSLRQSVEVALDRNPDLIIEKIRVEVARQKIEEEKGDYDPAWTLRGLYGRRDNVQASRFFPSGVFIEDDQTQEIGFGGRTYTGASYDLNLVFQRLKSTSNTQTLSPRYSANFEFSVTQPLFRDFGIDVNMTRIRVAQKGEEIAEQDLALGVSKLIQQVVEAYWNFVFLQEDFEVKKASLEFAKSLLMQTEDLLRAGRVTRVSVLEARAGVADREEAVIVSENEVMKAEDRLKLLLYADLDSVRLRPMGSLSFEAVDLDLQRSLDLAFKQRPEILRLQRVMEQRKLDTKFAFNQTLPRLDLTSRYGLTGLSGRPNKTPANPNVSDAPVGAIVQGSVFEGETRPKDAFDKFFNSDPFDSWSVELRLEIPLWNRTAKARLSEAILKLMETQAALRSLKETIGAEVRNARRDIVTARKRIESTRAAVLSIREALGGSRGKFEAGITTSYEVLQVVSDLADAKTRELRAFMDYNLATTALSLGEGSILEMYNVEIKKSPRFVFKNVP